jgi:hypothetical protein
MTQSSVRVDGRIPKTLHNFYLLLQEFMKSEIILGPFWISVKNVSMQIKMAITMDVFITEACHFCGEKEILQGQMLSKMLWQKAQRMVSFCFILIYIQNKQ